MKLLCITNPGTHPEFDTTVELYNVLARCSGITLFHTPAAGIASDGSIRVCEVRNPISYPEFLKLDEKSVIDAPITSFDLVFDRTDIPRPDSFFENLSQFEDSLQFVNRPSSLLRIDGRSFLNQVAKKHMPDYIFSRDVADAVHFIESFGMIVAKQNTSYGGRGVFKVAPENGHFVIENILRGREEFPTAVEAVSHLFSLDAEVYQFVRFLKNIDAGDKRVLVVDGEIYGGYLRTSSSGGWIHNITSGGNATASSVTDREREIVSDLAPEFHQHGIYTLGFDFLMDDDGEWILSEYAAGNVGGYGHLEELSGESIYPRLTDWLVSAFTEKRLLAPLRSQASI